MQKKKDIKIGFDGLLTRNEMLIKSWVQKERVKSRWRTRGCRAGTGTRAGTSIGSRHSSHSGRMGGGNAGCTSSGRGGRGCGGSHADIWTRMRS